MATTIQNLRSLTAGNYPGDLLAGELAFNLADGFMYIGTGGNSYVDTLNQTIGSSVAPGGGWQQAVFNSSPINGSVILAGIYDAQDNLVTSVTTAGTAAGFTVGALPASTPANAEYYVLVQIGGTLAPPAPAGDAQPGDWLVSSGTGWALVAESETIVPASNVTIVPEDWITGPNMQSALIQIVQNAVTGDGGTLATVSINPGNFSVDIGTSTFDGPVTVNNALVVNTPVATPVQINGSLTATLQLTAQTIVSLGNIVAQNNLQVNGNTVLGTVATNTVTVAGPITANNNLTVAGTSTHNGATQINGALTTTGSVSIAGTAGATVTTNVVFSGTGAITVGANNPIDINSSSVVFRPTTGVTFDGAVSLNSANNAKTVIYTRPLSGSSGNRLQSPLQNFLVIPGTIITYGGTNVPTGYLYCDGAEYLQTTYPDLFAAIGTVWGTAASGSFKVPDLRGLFLRGTGTNGTVNTFNGFKAFGLAVGGTQADIWGNHNHGLSMPTLGYGGVQYGGQIEALAVPTSQMTSSGRPNNGTIDMRRPSAQADNKSTPVDNAGGVETRPVNASVQYLIKF